MSSTLHLLNIEDCLIMIEKFQPTEFPCNSLALFDLLEWGILQRVLQFWCEEWVLLFVPLTVPSQGPWRLSTGEREGTQGRTEGDRGILAMDLPGLVSAHPHTLPPWLPSTPGLQQLYQSCKEDHLVVCTRAIETVLVDLALLTPFTIGWSTKQTPSAGLSNDSVR